MVSVRILDFDSDPTRRQAAALSHLSRRRLSQILFGFFTSTGAEATSGEQETQIEALYRTPADMLPDSPTVQDVLGILELEHNHGSIPDELIIVPGRINQSAHLLAIGFADIMSVSVGVDLALWTNPCSTDCGEIAWRRVFNWVISSDRDLANISIIDPPHSEGASLIGCYGYDTGGVSGYGILTITKLTSGDWRISDCWGDTSETNRVEELAAISK